LVVVLTEWSGFVVDVQCPAMILDEDERRILRFDSKNALVRDPLGEMEAERTCNPWTPDEQRIFSERFQVRVSQDAHRPSTALCGGMCVHGGPLSERRSLRSAS